MLRGINKDKGITMIRVTYALLVKKRDMMETLRKIWIAITFASIAICEIIIIPVYGKSFLKPCSIFYIACSTILVLFEVQC